MKKILHGIITVLLCLWQLPQEVVGAYLFLFYGMRNRVDDWSQINRAMIFKVHKLKGGASFGRFIYVVEYDKDLIAHEYGHYIQSQILGPLYFLVIGIPSAIWGLLYRESWKKDYYWFWTEKWANKLGKIK